MKQHKDIPLDAGVDGFQLAKPVVDSNGVVLIAEGACLTETIINKLLEKNVTTVCVEAIEPPDEDAIRKHRQVIDQLDHRFRNVMDDPEMRKLYEGLLTYYSRDI